VADPRAQAIEAAIPPPRGPIATSAATILDAVPAARATTPPAGTVVNGLRGAVEAGAPRSTTRRGADWTSNRDRLPTEGMTPSGIRDADGVARQIRRRGVIAAAWFALVMSGVIFTMTEGQRPAAGQSGSQAIGPAAGSLGTPVEPGGDGDVGRDRSRADVAATPRSPEPGWWTRSLVEPVQCAAGAVMGVRPAGTAPDRIEGKMEPARASRCPTVQNAEPTGAERLWSNPARSAGTGRSRPSAPHSRPSSPPPVRRPAPASR